MWYRYCTDGTGDVVATGEVNAVPGDVVGSYVLSPIILRTPLEMKRSR